ncbi:MAG: hypothetical protein ACE5LF_03390 [Alphaproteobacteria bacterium]
MNAHDRLVDLAHKLYRSHTDDGRLPLPAAVGLWILFSLIGWAVIIAVILALI